MTSNAADRCETDYICKYLSPIGLITLASNGTAVTGAWFEGQKYYASTLKGAYEEKEVPSLSRAKLRLDAYLAGVQPREELPLAFEGCSPFRKKSVRDTARDTVRLDDDLRRDSAQDRSRKRSENIGARRRRSGGAQSRIDHSAVSPRAR